MKNRTSSTFDGIQKRLPVSYQGILNPALKGMKMTRFSASKRNSALLSIRSSLALMGVSMTWALVFFLALLTSLLILLSTSLWTLGLCLILLVVSCLGVLKYEVATTPLPRSNGNTLTQLVTTSEKVLCLCQYGSLVKCSLRCSACLSIMGNVPEVLLTSWLVKAPDRTLRLKQLGQWQRKERRSLMAFLRGRIVP